VGDHLRAHVCECGRIWRARLLSHLPIRFSRLISLNSGLASPWLKWLQEFVMLLDIRNHPDVLVITPLESRVDVNVAPALLRTIIDRIDQGHHHLLINMERVQCIDSSGLGALVSAAKRLGSAGDMKVCSLSTKVRSMFERTRINRVIAIVE
jgi:anti-sigma B factor antagonist